MTNNKAKVNLPVEILPIIEYLPLWPVKSARSAKHEIFSEWEDEHNKNTYYQGIKECLGNTRGIYVFYDSSGRAIYVGKTDKQFLWKEINLAYNRKRTQAQNFYLVNHPTTNVHFKRTDEQQRQIKKTEFVLWEVAGFVSAYEINPQDAIGQLESLMIRAFANNLLNLERDDILLTRGGFPWA